MAIHAQVVVSGTGSRVELFAAIRRDARVDDLSIRELARRHGVHRRTVRQALASADPPTRKTPDRVAPKLGPYAAAVDAMLVADLDAPRKQRHTARRVHARLVEEHRAEVSYSTVRDYVRRRRPEIAVEHGKVAVVAMVPQEHAPGVEAEVDFGEVWVILDGVKTKCHLFVYRLSHSGGAVHRVYPTCGQEAFLEGHIAAFEAFGGVPTGHIRYDNLTSAVSQVLFGSGRRRTENPRWVLFRSHYGFDAFYCHPGIEGAHEKGGVEGEVGRFRRTWLTPMPEVKSLDELNEKIVGWEARDLHRRIEGRLHTVGHDVDLEKPVLRPLPMDGFDPGLVLNPRVDRSALVPVRMVKYSVPARLIGRRVRVSLQASRVKIFDGRQLVADHPRRVARTGSVVDLDHYLEVLAFKPGALPGSTALGQARAAGAFTTAHEDFWVASRRVNGDADGTRQLIDVLLLHRSHHAEDVTAGIRAALTVGAVTAEVVAVETRRHATATAGGANPGRHHGAHHSSGEQQDGQPEQVVSLTMRRLLDPTAVIAGLPPDTRPLPDLAVYDRRLLGQATGTDHPAPATQTGGPP
jgi:transposase